MAAPNSKTTKDALVFWREMNKEVPGIFEKIDGWASHSYPNHGFLGKPQDSGRTSIRGYQWELTVLKSQFELRKSFLFLSPKQAGHIKNSKLKYQNQNFTVQN